MVKDKTGGERQSRLREERAKWLAENAYGLSVTGHAHTPEILRGAWQVGTTSKLNLDYTKGSPSSWFQTACLVYPNGSRQLISVVDGKWCTKQEVTMQGVKVKKVIKK